MGRVTTAAKRTEQTPMEMLTPLQKISGIAYDMELQISDAIAIARTARLRQLDGEFRIRIAENYSSGYGRYPLPNSPVRGGS